MVVPKINVYLPDELATAVKEAGVPVSSICQAALERAVREVTSLRESERVDVLDIQDWAAATGIAFNRYTNRARQSVVNARQAALEANHAYVGTEHLLLGVLSEGANLAIKILQTLDVEPGDVEAEIRGYIEPGKTKPTDTPMASHTRRALELASEESAKLLHNYIGCEHLLLGLIAEPDGLAGTLLRQMGLELRITRRAVQTALAGYVHATTNARSSKGDRVDEILARLDAIEARLPA